MFLAKLFSNNRFIDANQDTHMLFAPNYLIKEKAIEQGMQYIFGGHSVINIQTTNGKKELNFIRTRAFKTSQLTQNCEAGIKMGFKSIDDNHYLVFSFNPTRIKIRVHDELLLTFEDGKVLKHTIKFPKISGQHVHDIHIPVTLAQLENMKKQQLHAYSHLPKDNSDLGLQCLLSAEFTKSFQEVAETYDYALRSIY
ncbi:MAG: hypothetical protein WBG71_02330 [Leeuwenhoekiella sp.]